MTMTLLDVSHLSVSYNVLGQQTKAVSDASFSVDRGEVIGIVGESGSGKSTATLAVMGLTKFGGRIDAGTVSLDGEDILGLSNQGLRDIRGERIGLVTQNPRGALSPVATVGSQLSTIYRSHRPKATEQDARARAITLLTAVGINDPERRLEAFPHELSGGMAQRVLIAMSLLCEPELLIADEPTSGLDVTVQAQVLDDLRHAASETGSALLIVTQDLGIVANYCDRVYLMHAGEILEQGPTRRMFRNPSSPATLALLAAQRHLETEGVRLEGFPVDPQRLPEGCWLSPRCPFATEEAGCLTQHPALAEVEPGHLVRCHRREHVHKRAMEVLATDAGPLEAVQKEHA
jgi:oligopeptide/dipeptide ABC transporter ATP-binding protein